MSTTGLAHGPRVRTASRTAILNKITQLHPGCWCQSTSVSANLPCRNLGESPGPLPSGSYHFEGSWFCIMHAEVLPPSLATCNPSRVPWPRLAMTTFFQSGPPHPGWADTTAAISANIARSIPAVRRRWGSRRLQSKIPWTVLPENGPERAVALPDRKSLRRRDDSPLSWWQPVMVERRTHVRLKRSWKHRKSWYIRSLWHGLSGGYG